MSDSIDSLERLLRLREAGVLNEDEFQVQKARILDPAKLALDRVDNADLPVTNLRVEAGRWIGTRRGKLVIFSALLLILTTVAGWWWYSPYWTLRGMKSALAARDAEAFSKYVDFPSLRQDLKADFLADSVKEARDAKNQGMGDGLALLGAAMSGPLIDGIVTPEGLRILFAMKNPDGRDFGIMNISSANATVVRTGLLEFRVKDNKGGSLIFTQSGFGWKLSGLDEPRRSQITDAARALPTTDSSFSATSPADPASTASPTSEIPSPPTSASTNVSKYLLGEWEIKETDCESIDSYGYSFSSDGKYSTHNEEGEWALNDGVLVLHHNEITNRIPMTISKDRLTLRFDDAPLNLRRCPVKDYRD